MIRHPAVQCDYRPGVCFDVGAAIGGAASAAGTVASTAMQISAEEKARKIAQETAATQSKNITNAGTNVSNLLSDYSSAGNNAVNSLSNGLTESYLQSTPGYKFTLNQGEQGVTNAAAARGLANSGAAEKGAASYATGLADSTYQNQYNDTMSLANMGLSSNEAQGNDLLGSTENAAQTEMEGANGEMSALTNTANAYQNGLTSLGNTASQYGVYSNLLNGSSSSDTDYDSYF